MRVDPKTLRASIAGLAAAGAVATHEVAFRIGEPDPHARLELLQRTGHSYWALIVALGVAALVFGGFRFVSGMWAGTQRGPGLVATSIRLAVLQVVGFAALEAVERGLSGGGVGHMLNENVFLIGIALQLVTALIGALLLVLLGRAVAAIASALRRPVRRATNPTLTRPAKTVVRAIERVASGSGTLRGPPASLAL
jgi:hypothetical protein